MKETKLHFIKSEWIPLLKSLDGRAAGKWGLMNGQQMVEHLTDAVKIASGKLVFPLPEPGEALEKRRAFLFSEAPMRENVKNPLLGDSPAPLRKPDMQQAIDKLQQELDYFFLVFEKNPALITMNPLFGELDFDSNIQLLYKHAQHHLKQFGLL